MPYISQLLGRPIVDVDGVKFGTLRDILAATRADRTHPEAVALLVQCGSGERIIPVSEAAVLVAQTIPLAKSAAEVSEYRPGEQDIRLERDVLDKQIIDIDGVRVVRVNDLELTRIHGGYYIANVDVSSRGLMRRLLPSGLMRLFPEPIHGKPQSGIISWENVDHFRPVQTGERPSAADAGCQYGGGYSRGGGTGLPGKPAGEYDRRQGGRRSRGNGAR
jgi:magnesium transporter